MTIEKTKYFEVLAGRSVADIVPGKVVLDDGRVVAADATAAALGATIRIEHEDHAKSHGRCAGANMAGAAQRYDYLPFFHSDPFDVGYEAVGELDARLNLLVDWSGDPADEGTFVYLDHERRPRGVLLWNRFGHLDAARALITAGEPVGRTVQVE